MTKKTRLMCLRALALSSALLGLSSSAVAADMWAPLQTRPHKAAYNAFETWSHPTWRFADRGRLSLISDVNLKAKLNNNQYRSDPTTTPKTRAYSLTVSPKLTAQLDFHDFSADTRLQWDVTRFDGNPDKLKVANNTQFKAEFDGLYYAGKTDFLFAPFFAYRKTQGFRELAAGPFAVVQNENSTLKQYVADLKVNYFSGAWFYEFLFANTLNMNQLPGAGIPAFAVPDIADNLDGDADYWVHSVRGKVYYDMSRYGLNPLVTRIFPNLSYQFSRYAYRNGETKNHAQFQTLGLGQPPTGHTHNAHEVLLGAQMLGQLGISGGSTGLTLGWEYRDYKHKNLLKHLSLLRYNAFLLLNLSKDTTLTFFAKNGITEPASAAVYSFTAFSFDALGAVFDYIFDQRINVNNKPYLKGNVVYSYTMLTLHPLKGGLKTKGGPLHSVTGALTWSRDFYETTATLRYSKDKLNNFLRKHRVEASLDFKILL